MRNVILHSTGDVGRVLENAVFLELLRRGYSVTSGSHYDREIDFVATKRKEVRYYQVVLTILDENTFNREVLSLESVPDNYPKTILTLDRINKYSIKRNSCYECNRLDAWKTGIVIYTPSFVIRSS